MIHSLWSLCQACPSMAADKRHLDHLGRYRWYEYRDVATSNVIDHAPQSSIDRYGTNLEGGVRSEEHLDQPSGSADDWTSRGGHYFMEPYPTSGQLQTDAAAGDPVVSATGEAHRAAASGAAGPAAGRRDQYPDRSSAFTTSEYRLQYAWPAAGRPSSSSSAPAMQPHDSTELLHHTGAKEHEIGRLLATEPKEVIRPTRNEEGDDNEDKPRRRRYKTEYRKKYRPFSLYQYVDGRFQKPAMAAAPAQNAGPEQAAGGRIETERRDTWYREVVELRKKAGEYKFRGLGGELLPEHMVDLYAKQFDVWDQVSRRSSLSALALAAVSPRDASISNLSRSSSKMEKDKILAARKNSPHKQRPGHAQSTANTPRKETARKLGQEMDRSRQRDVIQQRSMSAEGKTRARSAKPSSHHKSPAHTPGHAGNITLAIRPSLGAIFHPMNPSGRSVSAGPESRIKRTAHSTPTAPTAVRNSPTKAHAPRQGHKVSEKADPKSEDKENVVVVVAESDDVPDKIRDPDASCLIKSVPEPTRVKSPEQLVVRSPDPVNWTVPLDTGKTFTVTQNIRGDYSRPHSELKYSMTIRPATHGMKSGSDSGPPSIQMASATAGSSASATASAPSGAPEPLVAEMTSPVAETSSPAVEMTSPAEESAPVKMQSPATETAEPMETAADDNQVIHHPLTDSAPTATNPPLPATSVAPPVPVSMAAATASIPAQCPSDEKVIVEQPIAAVQPVKSVPGTTLRCLEDPLMSYQSWTGSLAAPRGGSAPEPVKSAPTVKGPRYRVLEAPGAAILPQYKVLEAPGLPSDVFYQPISSHDPLSSGSPYKVLEAPSAGPLTSAVAHDSPTASPSANRSLASDVLEKARTRFDRFWGKKEGDK